MKAKRKIRYIPGMISLIFLPIVSIIYFHQKDAFKKYGTIEIKMFLPNSPDMIDMSDFIVPFKTKYNYKTFLFTNDSIDNSNRLDQIESILNKLKASKDTIDGVKFEFSDSARYEDFINALDLLNGLNVAYVIEDSYIWTTGKGDILGIWGPCILTPSNKQMNPDAIKNKLVLFKDFWDIGLLYILMIPLSLRYTYRLRRL